MLMNIMDDSPCKGCEKRFLACSARCPIDAEGGYGYKAWREKEQEKQALYKEYVKQHNEDYKHSEEFDWKNRKRGWGR